jgi:hypothetical protein
MTIPYRKDRIPSVKDQSDRDLEYDTAEKARAEYLKSKAKDVKKEDRIMKRIPRNVIEAIEAVVGGDSALDVAGVLTNPQQEWPEGTSMFVPNRVDKRVEAPAGDSVPGQKDTGPKDSAGGGGTSRKENDLEGAL